MKHANRIAFLVVVMILSAASQANAQWRVLFRPDWKCVAGEWNLPASRWEALAIVAGEAREQLDNIEELLTRPNATSRSLPSYGRTILCSNTQRTSLNGKWPTVKEESLIFLSSRAEG